MGIQATDRKWDPEQEDDSPVITRALMMDKQRMSRNGKENM